MFQKIISVLLCAGMLLGASGCGTRTLPEPTAPTVKTAETMPVASKAKSKAAEPPAVLTLLAAGDNLIHDTIFKQAAQRTQGTGYDFLPAYSHVVPLIRAADIAVINQETILASDIAPPSNYPLFCTPTRLGEQLIDMGFDVFTLANNHAFDMGAAGIRASMAFWDKHPEAVTAGTYRDAAEREKISYTTVNGVKLAFLSCTETTNGLSLAKDAPEGVFLLSEEDALQRKLAEAHKNADFVVLSVHWGVEGSDSVSDNQRAMANKLAAWGADLILGTHPHVLQPCEVIPRESGGDALVVYSLGNFISTQRDRRNMAGGLFEVTIEKPKDGDARIKAHRFLPTVTQFESGGAEVRILPLSEYTEALAQSHGVNNYQSGFTMDFLEKQYSRVYPDCAVMGKPASPEDRAESSTAIGTTVATAAASPKKPAPKKQAKEAAPSKASLDLDETVDALCKKYGVVGMSVAAFKDNEVIYTRSYGMANKAEQIPAGNDTLYRSASISKAVTAIMGLHLSDGGKLDIDADISQYMGLTVRSPAHPDVPITFRQLMTHTSSIVDTGAYTNAISNIPYAKLPTILKQGVYSGYRPGSTFVYSNLGGGMMAGVTEGAAGERFWDITRKQLFEPLGIQASYLAKELPMERIAHIYAGGAENFVPERNSGSVEFYTNSFPLGQLYVLGHGELFITAPDLAKLGMIIAGDGSVDGVRILDAKTVAQMNTEQLVQTGAPKQMHRGLGVQRFPSFVGDRTFAGHQGTAYGMVGGLFYEPGASTGFALLTNGCMGSQRDDTVFGINYDFAQAIYKTVLAAQ